MPCRSLTLTLTPLASRRVSRISVIYISSLSNIWGLSIGFAAAKVLGTTSSCSAVNLRSTFAFQTDKSWGLTFERYEQDRELELPNLEPMFHLSLGWKPFYRRRANIPGPHNKATDETGLQTEYASMTFLVVDYFNVAARCSEASPDIEILFTRQCRFLSRHYLK